MTSAGRSLTRAFAQCSFISLWTHALSAELTHPLTNATVVSASEEARR